MKIEVAKKIISICEVGDDCTGCPALNDKNLVIGCVSEKDIAYRTIIADKDRQIEDLKNEALEMAELVSILHPLGHDRAQEIIEKYTKESDHKNG